EGLDSALRRAQLYRDAGADVIFFEAPQSEAEVEIVAHRLADMPLLFNWAEGGKTPPLGYERLRELGFRIIIFPIGALLATTRAIRDLLETIRADGTPAVAMTGLPKFNEFLELIGLPEIQALEHASAANYLRGIQRFRGRGLRPPGPVAAPLVPRCAAPS